MSYFDKRDIKSDIECEFNISEKCEEIYYISKRAEQKNRQRNNGKYICLYCSRRLKYSGRDNPNCKYDFDDNFFRKIDNDNKAYILGWIASDGSIRKSGFSISIKKDDIAVLMNIRDCICDDIPIKPLKNSTQVGLSVNSSAMSKDLCKLLHIEPGKKSDIVQMPTFISDDLTWAFIRGYFDGDGHVCDIHSKHRQPVCGISSDSVSMLNSIYNFVKIPGGIGNSKVSWSGNNALDFLGKIYNGAETKRDFMFLNRKYENYSDWCMWEPSLPGLRGNCFQFKWTKTDKMAVGPSKSLVSDSGYDLTIIKKVKEWDGGDVELYTTGIKIQPDFGIYFDLVPRSSISKTGYILANCLGVIDRTYTGPVLVALRKINKSAPDLELPCKIVQIIPRKIIHAEVVEVEELSETDRGEGGFGSTGVK